MILDLFNRYMNSMHRTDETNWNYTIGTKDAVIENIREYYVPKAFDSTGSYTGDKRLGRICHEQSAVFCF